MSITKKAKNLGEDPGKKYKCIRMNSKYHNLWEVKVIYQPGESDLRSTDFRPSNIANDSEVYDGDTSERMDKERARSKNNYRCASRKRKQCDSESTASKRLVETLNTELRNERTKNAETLIDTNNENRCLLEQNEAQQRLVADLEIELSAVSHMNTKLDSDLKSASTKIGSFKRMKRRDKEQEKGLVGSTLLENLQGVID